MTIPTRPPADQADAGAGRTRGEVPSEPPASVESTTTAVAAPARSWLPGLCLLAVIWGSSFLFIKVGLEELPPLYVAFGRALVGTVTLVIIVAVLRHRVPREPRLWAHLAVVATFGVTIPFALFSYAEERVSSTLAAIWNATTPLIVLPLACTIFAIDRMTARRGVGLLLGFAGVLVILGVWEGVGGATLTGQLMCLGAATGYGFTIPYFARFVAGTSYSGLALSMVQVVIAVVELAVLAVVVDGAPPPVLGAGGLSGKVIGAIIALGALGTGIAYVINTHNIRAVGASTASTVTYLIPIVATLLGVVVLREHIHWYQPVGGALVLAGVAVASNARLRRTSRVASTDAP